MRGSARATSGDTPHRALRGKRRTLRQRLGAALVGLALGCSAALPAAAAIVDPPPAPAVRPHALKWPRLQALAGKRLADPAVERVLGPALRQALGRRYAEFKASLADEAPLRIEAGRALVGEGVVPNTLGYRGAFFAFDRDGAVLAVLKSGRHGTTIERFGSLAPLKDHELLHAYHEFAGLDE
ncbi:hypothetical protein [Piscinibacter koreensis]|uniref:Uncharacterized protein n=1 Tax=Piscinibacter koreensis TaxID=2742824 RepID=A0A7Y6NPK5_9BURK|nr:hypothetical protein [Schlegelella koreensis]NUZ06892.1 hypothetical protein [Schlegelella koreensis]